MLRFVALTVLLSTAQGLPTPAGKQSQEVEPRQLIFIAQRQQQQTAEKSQRQQQQQPQPIVPQVFARQQYAPELSYGLAYLDPQLQVAGAFPRVQPQIVLYGPGGQGQPILINPGSPPGNFLVPQGPGPNVILGDTPERPVFIAGYPKPAHIPPIEKDAEEIPTNPSKIPPLSSAPPTSKPEKLETFNEGNNESPSKSASEADITADKKHAKLDPSSLKPNQRFFILNGDQLFTNYPLEQPFTQNVNLRYAQPLPLYSQSSPQHLQGQNLNSEPLENVAQPQREVNSQPTDYEPKFFDAPAGVQSGYFRNALPISLERESVEPEEVGQFRFTPPQSDNYFQYHDDVDNDAIIVDAQFEDTPRSDGVSSGSDGDSDSEVISRPEKEQSFEPSMAQAAPGAIALAGPGGVAGAAPRGTALVGKGGLAVSSPQATAVAGPKENETDKTRKTNKKGRE